MLTEVYKKYIKKNLMELLRFTDEVCEVEGINYSLFASTMIGAVRNKGILPWGDRIKIIMHRCEYEQFRSVIKKYLGDKFVYERGVNLVDRLTFSEKKYYNGELIIGFALDIYVIDRLPEDEKLRKKLLGRLKNIQGILLKGETPNKNTVKEKMVGLGYKVWSFFTLRKKLIKEYDDLSKQYESLTGKLRYISNNDIESFEQPFEANMFKEVIECPFETKVFKIFKLNDAILTKMYGDYKKLPSEEERRFKHLIEM